MSSPGRKKNEEKQIVKSCLQLRYFSEALFSKMKLCCKLEVVYSFSNSTQIIIVGHFMPLIINLEN